MSSVSNQGADKIFQKSSYKGILNIFLETKTFVQRSVNFRFFQEATKAQVRSSFSFQIFTTKKYENWKKNFEIFDRISLRMNMSLKRSISVVRGVMISLAMFVTPCKCASHSPKDIKYTPIFLEKTHRTHKVYLYLKEDF